MRTKPKIVNRDYEILKGINQSNSKSFDLLFECYYNSLCNYVASIIKNNEIAEDIIQDLFATIWINRKNNSINTLKSYLYRSAYNASLDYLKHSKIENHFQNEKANQLMVSYEDSVELYEVIELLEESIEQLPEQCKLIFKLSRFENLKYREIAQKLDITENTVDTQIRRALKNLKVKLKDYLIIFILIYLMFF